MTFSPSQGSNFQSVQEDPRVQTNIAKNIHPGQAVGFTISGEGQMPRDAQSSAVGKQAGAGMGEAGSEDTSIPGNRPGGGIGNPIGTPDSLTRYKWWILGGLAVLLAAGSVFLLRNRTVVANGPPTSVQDTPYEGRPLPTFVRQVEPDASHSAAAPLTRSVAPAGGNAALLNMLKEEMFAIESERISGTLPAAEYAEVKAGLEAILKRALKNR